MRKILLYLILIASIIIKSSCTHDNPERPDFNKPEITKESEWPFSESKNKVVDFLKSYYAGKEKVDMLSPQGVFVSTAMPNFVFKDGGVAARLSGIKTAQEVINKYKLDLLRIPQSAVVTIDGKQVLVQEKLAIDPTKKMDERYENYFAQFASDNSLYKRFKDMFDQLAIFVVATHYNDAKINNLPLLQDGSKIAIVDFDSLGKNYLNWETYAGAKALFLGGIDNNMAGKLNRTFVYPEFFASMNDAIKSKLNVDLPWDTWGTSLKEAQAYRTRELDDRIEARKNLADTRKNPNFLNESKLLSLKNTLQQKIDSDPELKGLGYGLIGLADLFEHLPKPQLDEPLRVTRVDSSAHKNIASLDEEKFLALGDKLAKLVFTTLKDEGFIAGFTIDNFNQRREQRKVQDKKEYTWDRIIIYY
jgi:hypothetical protein